MLALQALLVGILYYCSDGYSGAGGFFVSKYLLRQPLVGGFLCGLIFGELETGLSLGITLQLAYMGAFPVGGAMAMDVGAITYPTTAVALAANIDPGSAVAIGASISALSAYVTNIPRFVNVYFNKLFVEAIDEGNSKKWFLAYNIFPQIVLFLLKVIPSFIIVYFGADLIEQIIAALPTTLMDAMAKFAKILPAVGMGMLLKYIVTGPWSFAFFVLGFAMFAYGGINFLNVAIVALIIAYLYYRSGGNNQEMVMEAVTNDEDEEL